MYSKLAGKHSPRCYSTYFPPSSRLSTTISHSLLCKKAVFSEDSPYRGGADDSSVQVQGGHRLSDLFSGVAGPGKNHGGGGSLAEFGHGGPAAQTGGRGGVVGGLEANGGTHGGWSAAAGCTNGGCD